MFFGFQKSFDYTPGGSLPNAYHGIVYHRFTKYGAWKEAKTFVTIFDGGQSIIDFFSVRISNSSSFSIFATKGIFEICEQKERTNVKLMIITARTI